MRHGPPRGRRPGARVRWWDTDAARWEVRARVERYVEPALLLSLRDEPAHGYDLVDRLRELGVEGVDPGNLYRLLRSLEDEALVSSTWDESDRGGARSKRVYTLTAKGTRVLDAWADALTATQHTLTNFAERHRTVPGDQQKASA